MRQDLREGPDGLGIPGALQDEVPRRRAVRQRHEVAGAPERVPGKVELLDEPEVRQRLQRRLGPQFMKLGSSSPPRTCGRAPSRPLPSR